MLQNLSIPLFGADAFIKMRRAGALAAQVLDYIAPYVQPGTSTGKLNDLCHQYIVDHKGIPAPLNYKGFPKSICTSVNHVVCHGIPSYDHMLKDGDILNIDVTVILDQWHGDTSRMFTVGQPAPVAKKLLQVTYDCLMGAIELVKPGARLGDIGCFIQEKAAASSFSSVREFCGHGIGTVFHGPPSVLHFGQSNTGVCLEEGMFFTIEPMINTGSWKTKTLQDGWTVVTMNTGLSAQYEHTLGVARDRAEIFTRLKK